jgi:hypothetical protein
MKLIYIVIICAIGSCRKVNDNIYGHWHVFDNKFGYGDYITLDVYDSINPILGKYSIFPSVSGDFDEGKRELNFTGECGIFRFQYKWIKDTLYLQNHLADRFAINYSKSNCSPTIDIKNSFRVNVDFPTAQKCNVNRFFDENVEFQNIFIGEPTKEYSYYPGIRIVIGGKFSHIAEIPLWIAEIRKSYSKDRFKSRVCNLI